MLPSPLADPMPSWESEEVKAWELQQGPERLLTLPAAPLPLPVHRYPVLERRQSLEGLSVRSVFIGVFQSFVVLLYILDNETNSWSRSASVPGFSSTSGRSPRSWMSG